MIAARLIRLCLFLYFLLLHILNGGGAYESPTFQASVEAGVKDLDDVWVPALGKDVDLLEQAVQAFFLAQHVLDAHEFYSHFLPRR